MQTNIHNRITHLTEAHAATRPDAHPDANPATPLDKLTPALPATDLPSALNPLLSDFTEAALPLEGIAARHKLNLTQLLDIIESPAFTRLLARTEAAAARRTLAIARTGAPDAALVLRDLTSRYLTGDTNPEPARKAAGALLKLAQHEPEPEAPPHPDPTPQPHRERACTPPGRDEQPGKLPQARPPTAAHGPCPPKGEPGPRATPRTLIARAGAAPGEHRESTPEEQPPQSPRSRRPHPAPPRPEPLPKPPASAAA